MKLEEDIEDVSRQITSYAALALQFVEVGQLDGAEWAATQCLARAGQSDSSRFTVSARCALAEAHRRAGRVQHARREAELARNELQAARDLLSGSALRQWLEQRLTTSPSRCALRVWLQKWFAASSGPREND